MHDDHQIRLQGEEKSDNGYKISAGDQVTVIIVEKLTYFNFFTFYLTSMCEMYLMLQYINCLASLYTG